MNKTLVLSIALLIGAQAVQPLAASTESMYQDIVQNAINDSLRRHPKNATATQFCSIDNALYNVNCLREEAQSKLLRSYGYMNSVLMTYLQGLAGFVGIGMILSGINMYVRLDRSVEQLGICLAGGAVELSLYCIDKIEQYVLRRQIKQYNEVIAKLEVKKAELKKKIKLEDAAKFIEAIESI
jgi:hypothetical protein